MATRMRFSLAMLLLFAVPAGTTLCMAGPGDDPLHLRGHAEWRVHAGYGGIAGVWNPAAQTVEWRSHDGYGGIAGVWNPASETVEWKERRGYGGVAGAWVPDNADDYETYLKSIGLL